MRFSLRSMLLVFTFVMVSMALINAGVKYHAEHTVSKDDLRYVVRGMKKSEVEKAIGKPDRIESDGSWYYHAMNFYEGRLIIEFDDDDCVVRVTI